MAKIYSIVVLLFSFALAGCAGSSFNLINPPAVGAQSTPSGCDATGACSITNKLAWGYEDIATYTSAHTIAGTIEIGLNSTPTNANDATVALPLTSAGDLTSISGNVDYRSWGKNPASMIVDLRSCEDAACAYPSGQEHLATLKFTADPGSHTTIPFSARFETPIHVDHFMLVFNDDLDNAKPTTISVAFSGTFK